MIGNFFDTRPPFKYMPGTGEVALLTQEEGVVVGVSHHSRQVRPGVDNTNLHPGTYLKGGRVSKKFPIMVSKSPLERKLVKFAKNFAFVYSFFRR